MARFLISLIAALIVGAGIGLYLGWVQFPVEYTDSPADRLAQRYQDDYVVMVAYGYMNERDANAALERLRLLNFENIPASVQDTTERYITSSQRIEDIRALVTLSEGLGRLTPIMEPFRPVSPVAGAGS